MVIWGVVGSVLARPNLIYHFWTFSQLKVARKLEKLPWECVFELSEPLLGPGIGLWGIVGSVLARPNQIYLYWTFSELRVARKLEKLPRKCVFELSEPLLGPGIGLWGIIGSVLARTNQIYLYWTFLELRVARKLEKLPRKCVFELSEPLLGPGIGLCGIVGSVLARPNQIYLFWTFWNLGLPENRKNYPENVFLSSQSHFWGQV